jgi:hypothetical protein
MDQLATPTPQPTNPPTSRADQLEVLLLQVLRDLFDYMANGDLVNGVDKSMRLVIDKDSRNYQMLRVGWSQPAKGTPVREFGVIMHLSIENDKIWFQYNGTEFEVFDELEALGVAKSEMVIGFVPEYARTKYGYAAF